jgi:hypothetical protein
MKRLIRNLIQLKEKLNLYDFDTKTLALYEETDDNGYIIYIYNMENVKNIIKQFVIEKKNSNVLRAIPDTDYLEDKLITNYGIYNKAEYPKNCWKINQTASKKGTGYTMYILMMSQLPQGHYLISDRFNTSQNLPPSKRTDQVSTSAQKLWLRFFNDSDIYKKPIDNIQKPITPDKNDDGYTLFQLSDPNDISTTDYLDYMYRIKDSIKSSYQAKIEQLKNNHDKFISDITKEIINDNTQKTINKIKPSDNSSNSDNKERPPLKINSIEKDYSQIKEFIINGLETMGSKYFRLKYKKGKE